MQTTNRAIFAPNLLLGPFQVITVLFLLSGSAAPDIARAATDDMAVAANAFLEVLSEEQRARTQAPLDSDERTRWGFVPSEMFPRAGITLGELDGKQSRAAHALLRSGLSQHGYITAAAIMELERVLNELEGGGGRFARNPLAYHITVFGTPSAEGSWAWRFEGHHLSLHFTLVNGSATVSTPTFLGANPAEIREGPRRGTRALAAAEDAARDLLQSLDSLQRAQTIVSADAPGDILSGTAPTAEPITPAGLSADQMTPAQQLLLRRLIEAHTGVMSSEIAAERWRRIREAGFGNVAFAWAGSADRGSRHYYRIQGPTFLVEYDNTQNDANHIHTVWRDFEGDFGRDLLREHLKSVQH